MTRRAGVGRCWLYGVVGAADLGALILPERGVYDAPVTTMVCGDVAAVLSPIGAARVRSSRAALLAHQEVVEQVGAAATVLPAAFGTVFDSGERVTADMLEPQHTSLRSMLAEMEGREEWRVTARYDGDAALRSAVERDPTIRRLRSRATGYAERIRLGELVAAAVEQVRDEDAQVITKHLTPHVVDLRPLPARGDDVALHAAALVERRSSGHFERSLERLADESAGRIRIHCVGPLAPWDFVGEAGPVEAAAVSGRR